MTVTWGEVEQRLYETGVDRGVLFVDAAPGVSWNGLVAVSENSTGGEVKAYYIDGFKYLNLLSGEEFEATIEAYTYPDEFGQCDGTESLENGLYTTQQAHKPFGLSYRTQVGNESDGSDYGYKIHLVYNALAAPSDKAYSTMNDSPEAMTFSWALTTSPSALAGRKPTAHLIIESRKTPPDHLQHIEYGLYGDPDSPSTLPTIPELIYVFSDPILTLDAGGPGDPYSYTYNGGIIPGYQERTIDGGNSASRGINAYDGGPPVAGTDEPLDAGLPGTVTYETNDGGIP
jgi:hypothetical protein